MKSQIPKSKLQKSSKSQAPNNGLFKFFRVFESGKSSLLWVWGLKLGVFLEFGVWSLGFLWSLELGAWFL